MRGFLPAGFSVVYSSCPGEQFHGKHFLLQKKIENSIIFRSWAQIIWTLQKISKTVVKTWLYVSRGPFRGIFWNESSLMKIFGLRPKFFEFKANTFRAFLKTELRASGWRIEGNVFQFHLNRVFNVTGNLRSSFLFNWENLFWRFLATVSFVSGGTVWDYEFFIGSIKVVGILLDIELQLFWTWMDSCQQVFQECIHRVQKNLPWKRFLFENKQKISSLPEVERKQFSKFGRSVSRLLSLVGSTCPSETFEDFFWKKNLDTLWLWPKFLGKSA